MVQAKEIVYKYRWVILGVVWLGYTSFWIQRLSIPPLAPFLREELYFTHTQIGLLMSAVAFAALVIQLPAGWLVDRFGVRPMLLICQVVGGICLLGMSRINSFTSAIIFMSLVGLWCGGLTPVTTKGVMDWFPLKERATVMGLKQTGVNIGGIAMAATMPALALVWGWRGCFLFIATLVVAFGVISFALYRKPPKKVTPPIAVSSTATASWGLFRKVVLSREILCLSFGSLFIAMVEFGAITHLAVYLNEAMLFTVIVAGLGLAVLEGGGAFGKPLSGLLSDRVFGSSRKRPFILMAFIACALCVVLAFITQTTPLWVLFPVLAILGLTAVGWGGLWLTLVGEFAGREKTGVATGFSTTIVTLGSGGGPFIFGYIVDLSGSYQPAWLLMAVFAAMCTILLFFVRESKRIV